MDFDQRMVSRVGFEPTTPGLKVRCSSAELTAPESNIGTRPFHCQFTLAPSPSSFPRSSTGIQCLGEM